MTSDEKEFIRGAAAAIALVGNGWVRDISTAQRMVGELGFTKKDFVKAHVEPSDMEKIWPKPERKLSGSDRGK